MLVTLAEAAALMHKSERQLRYMLKLGTLHATKVGSRWMIDRSQLPQDGRAIEAEARRVDRVVEIALRRGHWPSAGSR